MVLAGKSLPGRSRGLITVLIKGAFWGLCSPGLALAITQRSALPNADLSPGRWDRFLLLIHLNGTPRLESSSLA